MKIIREIDGVKVEIELTSEEVREAYLEEQAFNDREDIEDYLIMYDLDEDTREEFEELFGFEYDQVSENEELLMRMGKEMRLNLDDRGMGYDRAREKAVESVLKEYKAEINADARERNLAKLPERCFGCLEYTGQLIIIVKGEDGYYDAGHFSSDDPSKNKRLADEHNAEMGVSKAEAAAMFAGSMFGWHVPAADPDMYDKDGKLMPAAAVKSEELGVRSEGGFSSEDKKQLNDRKDGLEAIISAAYEETERHNVGENKPSREEIEL